MAFRRHTWAKAGLVTGCGILAGIAATFYGADHAHEHGRVAAHAHPPDGSAAGHSHADAALLVAAAGLGVVAAAGLGVVAVTWLLFPEVRRRKIPGELALCSAAAATIHFAVVSPHWDEYAPFAVLFAITGTFQLAWAAAVLVRPTRGVLLLGAVVSLGVAAAWLLSRTAGLPIGPDAWTPEPVGTADVVATVFELAIAAGSVALASSAGRRLEARTTGIAAQLAALAIAVTLIVALTLA